MKNKKVEKKNNSIAINARTLKLLYKKYPQMIVSTIINSIWTALTPYVGIYLSALIIEELAGARNIDRLKILVLITVVSLAVIALISALIKKWNETQTSNLYFKFENFYTEKLFKIDFVSLDDIKTKYQTGNVSLDAILNSKLSIVEKEKIAINCKVEIAENLAVSDIDLCILLGNLIDNAVEACRGIPEQAERFLRIYMCIRKQQLYISVSNATNEVIRKLDAEYISKKRGDHGHGLKRINIVVDKYGGFIKRANEPGVFVTEIMLPL